MDTLNFKPKLSPDQYAAMSVWDLYKVMTSIVSLKNTYDLICCAEDTGETAVFAWAEEREKELDEELQAIAKNLAGRSGLSVDDEETRKMAFGRVHGYVPEDLCQRDQPPAKPTAKRGGVL